MMMIIYLWEKTKSQDEQILHSLAHIFKDKYITFFLQKYYLLKNKL